MFWGNMMLPHWPCFNWKFYMIRFHKILKLIFQTQPSCPINTCTEHWKYLTWQLSWKLSYILRTVEQLILRPKKSHQSPNFETFKRSAENLSNFLCHFWKPKSVFLQMFYQYWVLSSITPLYFLSSSIIYFGQKQPIEVQIFKVFQCFGQNLINSSCQFWTDKSIPFHVLHHSSLS